jgi:hypothetical protein
MGVVFCENCEIAIDLDTNLEDYDFKTKLCVYCANKDNKMKSFDEEKAEHEAKGDKAAKKLMGQLADGAKYRMLIEQAIIDAMKVVIDESLNLEPDKIAQEIVDAIESKEIPHVTINY